MTMPSNNNSNHQNKNDVNTSNTIDDIEDFHVTHKEALCRGKTTYNDPATGFTVFTELIHLKRGKCCGNKCRHCPYGFDRVKLPKNVGGSNSNGGGYRRRRQDRTAIDDSKTMTTTTTQSPSTTPSSSTITNNHNKNSLTRIIPGAPIAKLSSGDTETAQKMVQEIMESAEKEQRKLQLQLRNTIIDSNTNNCCKVDDYDDDDTSSVLSSTSFSSSSSSTVPSTDTNSSGGIIHDGKTMTTLTKEAVKTRSTKTTTTIAAATITAVLSPPLSSLTVTTTTTTKNVPYTRSGDQGTSQLGTGERRYKTDDAFEAMGTVDELCSFVGVAHSQLLQTMKMQRQQQHHQQSLLPSQSSSSTAVIIDYGNLPDRLLDIMSRLFDVGSHIAKPPQNNDTFRPNGIGDGFDSDHIDDLEEWINEMTDDLPELLSFILPTGAIAAAQLHVARTVCRRAERRVVPLVVEHKTCDPNALRYLNRLSDYFFVVHDGLITKNNKKKLNID
eukprot:CAMPEP_0170791730 /NCGR_PEP_ID=MMETSP0733-20121128/21332_1 /TAXON_ID=186038 /ORGANISM="Fragilariopsis kerguelensis, Strain L26-C5" /LENGTH=497 /DNA_ID=CAMNT_0011139743 /DNA_START=253 /DNA_END=1747 /DNA_ORIENTATION=+